MIRRPGLLDRDLRSGRLRDGRAAFAARIFPRGEPVLSPVSGTPCAYWRLRVAERINGALQLVHEITSTEDFELRRAVSERAAGVRSGEGELAGGGERGFQEGLQVGLPDRRDDGVLDDGDPPPESAVRVRVAAQTAQIEATPVLHRPGSPGALAVARQFGFLGQVSVEEVTLAAGEEIAAEGFIDGADECFAGAYRTVTRDIELLGATLRQPPRPMLGPALLPFALGTVAALLGGVGIATWAAWHFDLLPRFRHGAVTPRAEIGPDRPIRRHFSQPE